MNIPNQVGSMRLIIEDHGGPLSNEGKDEVNIELGVTFTW
jgi:hypothetical protein